MRAALLIFAAALPLVAQSLPPFACTAGAPGQRIVRPEGKAELVADVVVTCTGGLPTAVGVPIPAVTITLVFNAAVASRVLGAGNALETLLLLDEPAPGAQFPCTTATCAATGNGIGSGYYGPTSNPNVFQGAAGAGANTIVWTGIPIDPSGSGIRTFRFTNLRLDPTSIVGASLQVVGITIPQVPVLLPGGALTLATAQTGLRAVARDAADAVDAPNGVNVTLAANGAAATRAATLRFNSLFFGAAVPRTDALPTTLDAVPPPAAQNFPGSFSSSESGFFAPSLPTISNGSNLGTAGLADWGTRLMATFTNIPSNVSIYVNLRNDGATTDLAARLIATDASGAGPFSAIAGNGTFVQLTPSGGAATAVWEVLSNNIDSNTANFDFGVYFSYGPNIFAAPPPVNVVMRFAPVSAAGIPRFSATTTSQRLASFTATALPPPIPTLNVSPANLTFRGTAGGQNPPSQTVVVGTNPVGLPFSIISNGTLALSVQPPSGNTPATSVVSINTKGLAAGTYDDVLTVSAPQNTAQVPVTLVLAAGPIITSLSPPSALAGSPAFTLTVNGLNFTRGTNVLWNGGALSTTFGSAAQLTAAVPASLVAAPGQASITAVTPDGATSNAVTFTITLFTLTAISPNAVAAGGPAFTLTATGVGFQTGATLNVGGAALQPSASTPTSLTATVPASAIAQPGPLSVTVTNPNGQVSNALTLTVTQPITLTRISPDTVTATANAFTLNLTGSGFASGATVLIGGGTLTPTSSSGTQITVTVPADVIAQPAQLPVRVANPNGVTSNTLILTVKPAPRITALSPAAVSAGALAFTLTVTGTNLDGCTVRWNGQGLATAAVSATQLTAQVPAALVATAGTAQVNVSTVDGVLSNSLPFTVNPGLSITALSPATANVGAGAFTLTVTGANLPQGAQVNWNGQGLATAFVSATQLTAQVPASLLGAAGTANITVTAPDGAASNALPFRIVLPPLPNVSFSAPANAASGVDQTVTVAVGGAYPVDLRAALTLTFTPDTGLPDDPAIQFQNGSRVMAFTIPAGTTPAPPTVLVKTGTVAGVITVTLTFTTSSGADVTPAGVAPQRIQIGRAAPSIASMTCSRNATGFTVVIDGYTNTREATQATFDFTAASGASLGTTQLVVTAGPLFGGWFGSAGSTGAGGLFRYTQPFTVQGSATSVAGLAVRLGNSAGTSPSASCQLQ